jgi:hypothetical protein
MRPDLEYVKTLERENRQLRNESEFIKKPRRTLQETRGKVRDNKKYGNLVAIKRACAL